MSQNVDLPKVYNFFPPVFNKKINLASVVVFSKCFVVDVGRFIFIFFLFLISFQNIKNCGIYFVVEARHNYLLLASQTSFL